MKFLCNNCKQIIDIHRVKFAYIGHKLVCKEAVCCDEYMKQIITEEYEGVPEIKRNDSALNNEDNLWNDFKYNNTEK